MMLQNPFSGLVNFKSLNDSDVIRYADHFVTCERDLFQNMIAAFQEIENRKLYVPYKDMYEFFLKRYKFSQSTAYERVAVLKIAKELPEVAENLSSGELNVTTLTLAKTFFNKQEKEKKQKLSTKEKQEVLTSIKNKTAKEVKELFAEIDPVFTLPPDQVKYLNQTHVQILMTSKKEILEKIEAAKSLISHKNLNPTYEELFSLALEALIEKEEKQKGLHAKKEIQNPTSETGTKDINNNINDTNTDQKDLAKEKMLGVKQQTCASLVVESSNRFDLGRDHEQAPEDEVASIRSRPNTAQPVTVTGKSRYVRRHVKRFSRQRAGNRCEHIHPNGERCNSRFQLEFDHIIPFSKGGSGNEENIQVLCRAHNAHKRDH